jgi:hypothetical protein
MVGGGRETERERETDSSMATIFIAFVQGCVNWFVYDR